MMEIRITHPGAAALVASAVLFAFGLAVPGAVWIVAPTKDARLGNAR